MANGRSINAVKKLLPGNPNGRSGLFHVIHVANLFGQTSDLMSCPKDVVTVRQQAFAFADRIDRDGFHLVALI
jgi:hypothetical protein